MAAVIQERSPPARPTHASRHTEALPHSTGWGYFKPARWGHLWLTFPTFRSSFTRMAQLWMLPNYFAKLPRAMVRLLSSVGIDGTAEGDERKAGDEMSLREERCRLLLEVVS